MCKSIISAVVFTFNIICFLVGVALLTVGIMYCLSYNDLTDQLPKDYNFIQSIPYLTITVGSVIAVIAFLGCCGIVKESPCLLTTYAIILLILFIGQVALGVFAFVSIKDTKDLETKVKDQLTTIFNQAKQNHETTKGPAVAIQEAFQCCGLLGPDFWDKPTPDSCYIDGNSSNLSNLNKKGCIGVVTDFLKDSMRIIGIVTLSLSVTEVAGGVLALCLANSIRNSNRRNNF